MPKKALKALFPMLAVLLLFATGCSREPGKRITVITREDGSGTRSAFTELFGIEIPDEDGRKLDRTTKRAETEMNTANVMAGVAGNPRAIGYVSLGSLNGTVKALRVNGVAPGLSTVRDGSYEIQRPFNILTKGALSDVAQDFVSFILSSEGQAVVEKASYIPLDNLPGYSGSRPAGKVLVDGSSSVAPVMEKLKEAYEKINPDADIQINESDSSTGVKSIINASCDIGMASRKLKPDEIAKGAAERTIAIDGIVVIVNKSNALDNATKEQIMGIYTGEITAWEYFEDAV